MSVFAEIANDLPVVLSMHLRTRKIVDQFGLMRYLELIVAMEPLSYLDMIALEQTAKVILADSGEVQKETFFYGNPCITMQDETEWGGTVSLGWNLLTGASHQKIQTACKAVMNGTRPAVVAKPYGEGIAGQNISNQLFEYSFT